MAVASIPFSRVLSKEGAVELIYTYPRLASKLGPVAAGLAG
jgi:hypothetical protein